MREAYEDQGFCKYGRDLNGLKREKVVLEKHFVREKYDNV